jgi:hypothetical protein
MHPDYNKIKEIEKKVLTEIAPICKKNANIGCSIVHRRRRRMDIPETYGVSIQLYPPKGKMLKKSGYDLAAIINELKPAIIMEYTRLEKPEPSNEFLPTVEKVAEEVA